MLAILENMKVDYDTEVGFVGFTVVGRDEKHPSLLKVQKKVLGTEYREFPKRTLYYDYSENYRWGNKKNRNEIIIMSQYEFDLLPNNMEELLNREYNLYYVNIFSSDKEYSFYSNKVLNENSCTKVLLRNGNYTTGYIVRCGGKITLEEIIKNGYSVI